MTTMNSCEIDHRKISLADALTLDDMGKRKYFDGVLLRHTRIAETLAEMAIHADAALNGKIVLLIGPTGVGKTTMIRGLEERTILAQKDEVERDPGIIPVASIVAPASGERGFPWRMFYSRLGAALNEPLMTRKLEARGQGDRVLAHMPGIGSTVAGMRMAVDKIIQQRQTKVIVVDEAVPILRQVPGNRLANHMDALKTFADMKATIVLVGSYDLYELAMLNDQVARRTCVVHFSRYMTGVRKDEEDFRKVIRMLQARLPIRELPDLTEFADNLHVASLGCVGLLKTILATTLEYTLKNGGKWSVDFLERSLLSDALYGAILRETILGEARASNVAIGTASFKSLRAKAAEVTAKLREGK